MTRPVRLSRLAAVLTLGACCAFAAPLTADELPASAITVPAPRAAVVATPGRSVSAPVRRIARPMAPIVARFAYADERPMIRYTSLLILGVAY